MKVISLFNVYSFSVAFVDKGDIFYARRYATTIFRATIFKQYCANPKKRRNNVVRSVALKPSSLRIVPFNIALTKPPGAAPSTFDSVIAKKFEDEIIR